MRKEVGSDTRIDSDPLKTVAPLTSVRYWRLLPDIYQPVQTQHTEPVQLHTWRRPCSLDDQKKTSVQKLDQHFVTTAQGETAKLVPGVVQVLITSMLDTEHIWKSYCGPLHWHLMDVNPALAQFGLPSPEKHNGVCWANHSAAVEIDDSRSFNNPFKFPYD